MRETHGPVTGSFSYAAGSTSSTASFSTFQSGLAGTVDWITQKNFSYDKLDGKGPSK